ncbi:MAG: tryptophan synthase subunit alpha [Bacteroidales bacterium]|nr:tryptophan synthase subunit alpha [Bacteroidales bacterium]
MNRIDQLFRRKNNRILSVYMTAGYPRIGDTVEIIKALESSGVDMIEIGIPFSDPLADGEVIQKSSQQALENGMSLKLLFSQLKGIRSFVNTPLVLMGYLNPVLAYGFRKFIEDAVRVGIDGLILPDLPLEIYRESFREDLEDSGMKYIMLITPQTSENRIREIVGNSGGFLYMVADSATTGARNEITGAQVEYFRRVGAMKLHIPRLIGFGISNAETFNRASSFANGAIIGSAFISALGDEKKQPIADKVEEFVASIIQHP